MKISHTDLTALLVAAHEQGRQHGSTAAVYAHKPEAERLLKWAEEAERECMSWQARAETAEQRARDMEASATTSDHHALMEKIRQIAGERDRLLEQVERLTGDDASDERIDG